jgi:hypothetical protein
MTNYHEKINDLFIRIIMGTTGPYFLIKKGEKRGTGKLIFS